MNSKPLVFIFMFIGSTIGGLVPLLWGGSAFSYSSLVFSAVGAIGGIYIGYNLGR